MRFDISKKLSRRAAMTASLAAAVGLNSTSLAIEPRNDLDIIDCHTHFYDPERPQGVPWPGKGTSLYRTVLPKHLRALKQYKRVTGTVIVEASPLVEDNAWLLELAKDDPFVVGIVGNLKPDTPECAGHLKRFAANPLFRGIRISSGQTIEMTAKNRLDDLKRMVDLDLALDVNGGPETPAAIAGLAAIVPNLRIVLNHIGNVRITPETPPRDWAEGIRAAASHANVFVKISALVESASRDGKKAPKDLAFYKPYIDVVWNAFGNERVIYGSDWPVCESAADYETMQRIVMEYAQGKGDLAVRQFCSLNAKRAYKWVERPGRLQQ